MERILYLVHRIPFPPNKGDKIRSFNILKHLKENYEVVLGCFIDDPNDQAYTDKIDDYCIEKLCLPLNPTAAKIKSLKGLVKGAPLTLDYYSDSTMQTWVDTVIEKYNIDKVLIFSSSMAQFVDGSKYEKLKRNIDFVDVDSDKWRQYVPKTSFPMNWVYSRESKKLGVYEQHIAKNFDNSHFVTPDEVALFQTFCPTDEIRKKISVSENGVDAEYFNPAAEIPEIDANTPCLTFTGAMDYWANADAVIWFAKEVWPNVIKTLPDAHFYIVGGNPSPAVSDLAKVAGITVTGRVPDVRPYIAAATAVVAPLRIARGIQNKVLEAMAMDKAVVATTMAMEGISTEQGKTLDLHVHDSPTTTADTCINLLKNRPTSTGANRQFVLNNYAWAAKLEDLILKLK